MYFVIPNLLIKDIKPFFNLMVATMQSYFWLIKKVSSVKLSLDDAEQFLILNGFSPIVPSIETSVKELVNSSVASDSLVIFTSNADTPIIGVINNSYYNDVNCDSLMVNKYYVNHQIGHKIYYKCTKCGKCCLGQSNSFIVATKAEAQKIADIKHIALLEAFNKEIKYHNADSYYSCSLISGRCKYLKSNNECDIIECLPYNCQLKVSAYLFMNIFGAGINFFRCPGIGNPEGELYDISEINADIDKYFETYPFLK